MAVGQTPKIWRRFRNLPTVPPLLRGLYGVVWREDAETGNCRVELLNWCMTDTYSWVPADWLEPLAPDAEARLVYVAEHYQTRDEWTKQIIGFRHIWHDWAGHLSSFGHATIRTTWFGKDVADALGRHALKGGQAAPGSPDYERAEVLWQQLETARAQLAVWLTNEVGV